MTNSRILSDTQSDRTRTLVIDLPMPDLLHALLTSDSYFSHVRFRADVDVALLTDAGMKTAKIVPHDGDLSPTTMEDYFVDPNEETPTVPHDKSSVTLVSHDDTDQVNAVAEVILRIAREASAYSRGAHEC